MKDPIFLRTGSYTALAGLFVLLGATTAAAQDPPRRIPPRIVAPTPPPASTEEEKVAVDSAQAGTPAPTPPRTPGQIRRVPPVVTSPTPATTVNAPQIRRVAPVITSPAPAPTPVAPRRRAPVTTTPTPPSAPDTVQIRRAPSVVATPPAPPPTGPVRPRRVPPVITSPTPAAPDASPADVRRRPPVIITPVPADVRRRPPVIIAPDGVVDSGGAATQPTTVAAPPGRPPLTPVRPRPGDLSSIPASVIIPPADGQTQMLANSMTLRPGGYTDLVGRLPIVRQIPSATLRSNPIVKVGKMKADFGPVLKNPKALINIAAKLRAMPDLVEVRADLLEAVEVDRGLVVHNVLTYDFKPGACRDAGRRARIASAGISCFTRATEAEIIAGYSDPRDVRYVRDPRERARAIAYVKAQRVKMDADIAANVGGFRGQLADPAQRAQLAADAGEAEVARLAALDDTALAGELINNNETKVEQVTYLPSEDPAETAKPASPAPPVAATPDINVSYPIGEFTYLTGFTLGRQYEWKQRVETTIKWCLFGCKKTYYAEVSAGFSYGFGLRFPIRLDGAYNYRENADGKQGSLTATIATINGSAADYTSTGLPGDKLFDGKELVAEFTAHAGVAAKLPLVGQIGPIDIPIGLDFTTLLPGDFANGQFKPPEPGKPGPSAPFIFEQFDMLGGRGNYGILGAQVFPAVDLTLTSQLLTLTLRDKNKQTNQLTVLNAGTTEVPLILDPADDAANFAIEDPKYNLTFKVTPGIDARLFIDLAVWGTKWDWLVWFPQLSIELPPGGLDFKCHDGTVCSHDFRFKPTGEQSEFMGRVEKWGRDYDALWAPKCLDASCDFGVRLSRQSVVFSGKAKDLENPKGNANALFAEMTPLFIDARKRALAIIADSQARKSGELSNAMGILAQAIWAKQCKDSLCFDNITALTSQMGPRGAEIGKANPDLGTTKINQMVNKEFVPKLSKEIDDSKLRESVAQAQAIAAQTKQLKQPKLIR